MKNLHLVPPSVVDIVEKLHSPIAHENEKHNYVIRLEAIRDYCSDVITKQNQRDFKPQVFRKKIR
jgi:hypothetical protein